MIEGREEGDGEGGMGDKVRGGLIFVFVFILVMIVDGVNGIFCDMLLIC